MTPRPQLIYICDEYPDLTPVFGGIGVAVKAEAEWMVDQGVDVTVVSTGETASTYHLNGVRIVQERPVGTGRVGAFRTRLARARRVAAATSGAVVVAPDFTGPLITRPFDGKLVVRVHGAASVNAASRGRRPQPTVWLYERRLISIADMVLGTSAEALSAVQRTLKVSARSTAVIKNAVDAAFLAPLSDEQRLPEVVFVGKLSELKGLDMLCEIVPTVLERVPDARFSIVGHDVISPTGSAASRLLARVDEEHRGRVRVLGRLDRISVLHLLSTATAMVMPSRSEAMPMAALEAMARATPVVASEVGGLPEIIDHGHNGYLVPADSLDGFVSELARLLTDAEEQSRVGMFARRHIEEHHSPDQVFRRLLEEHYRP